MEPVFTVLLSGLCIGTSKQCRESMNFSFSVPRAQLGRDEDFLLLNFILLVAQSKTTFEHKV